MGNVLRPNISNLMASLMSKKTTQLKNIIYSKHTDFLMEAHNGISAKIAEEAGFRGLWASGFAISASLGVRDNNEISWTQVLDVLEFMSDTTSIPILLDGDTGYGNFNNMRRLVQKLEQRYIAGVCIEDKLFPKTNSFINAQQQKLADISEFCGKIKAGRDIQKDADFCIVARTEAFIAGYGLKEALRRAEAYKQAGADAILVHSKKSDPSDIEAFMSEWVGRHPVIIVPTKYYSTPTERFEQLGISVVIWANHSIRAAAQAIKDVTQQIYEKKTLIDVEDKISPVSEIFRLQGAKELQEAEKKYIPTSGENVNVIILAAGQGSLGELTKDTPKTLLKVNGKPILVNQVDLFNLAGIRDVSVVCGFGKDKITTDNINKIYNSEYAETKDLYSLYKALDVLKGPTVISYGDIIFKGHVLNELLNDDSDITIIVDVDCQVDRSDIKDYVTTKEPYSKKLFYRGVEFVSMSSDLSDDKITGEFIGLWKVSHKGAEVIRKTLNKMSKDNDFKKLFLSDLFNIVAKKCKISVRFIRGSWLDIDTIADLQRVDEI